MSVLILDPSSVGRLIAKQACDQLGFRGHSVISGKSALDTCQTVNPHVVVLDCAIPDMSVSAFCRFLVATPLQRVPTILITGDNVISLMHYFHEVSLIQDYLMKPYQTHACKTAIHRVGENARVKTGSIPALEARKRMAQMRKLESDLAVSPNIEGHLQLAQDYFDMQMFKDSNRQLYKAALLESPNVFPRLAGVIRPSHELPNVVQLIAAQRMSGFLRLTNDKLGTAEVHFFEGRMMNATGGGLEGKACVEACLISHQGEYEFYEGLFSTEDVIGMKTEEFLAAFQERNHRY